MLDSGTNEAHIGSLNDCLLWIFTVNNYLTEKVWTITLKFDFNTKIFYQLKACDRWNMKQTTCKTRFLMNIRSMQMFTSVVNDVVGMSVGELNSLLMKSRSDIFTVN